MGWPGVRRAGLPRQSPALTPGQRRRRRRPDSIRLNSATWVPRQGPSDGKPPVTLMRPNLVASSNDATLSRPSVINSLTKRLVTPEGMAQGLADFLAGLKRYTV